MSTSSSFHRFDRSNDFNSWRSALKPHQAMLFDELVDVSNRIELVKMSQRIVKYLADHEMNLEQALSGHPSGSYHGSSSSTKHLLLPVPPDEAYRPASSMYSLERDDGEDGHGMVGENEKIAPSQMPIPMPNAAAEPDGGLAAWLQVVGSFLVFANIWGFAFTFGSFQSYYQDTLLPCESASSISWIGTVSSFLLICIGVVSGPIFDLGYFRTCLFIGAVGQTLGVMLMSISDKYWQLFLTQGLLIGITTGLLYLPSLTLVGRSFKKQRAVALAISSCGVPVGGIFYTLIFEQLISRTSFGWTVRVMGFVMLGTYCISYPLLMWGASNFKDLTAGTGAARKLFDRAALKDVPFWLYTSSNFFIFVGYLIPLFFFSTYAQVVLGLGRTMALNITIINLASSIPGRLLTGYAATKIGTLLPWIACGSVSGICIIAWIGAHSTGTLITIAVLYGFFSGAVIPLPPSAFPAVCPDRRVLGARLGMAQGIGSVAALIGAPIAAALVEASSSASEVSFLGAQLFGGLIMIVGALNLVILWVVLAKRKKEGSKWI